MINMSLGESEAHVCFYVFFSFGNRARQTFWSSLHQKPTSPYRHILSPLVFKKDSTLLIKTLYIEVFQGFQSIFFKKCVDCSLKQSCTKVSKHSQGLANSMRELGSAWPPRSPWQEKDKGRKYTALVQSDT